MQCILHISRCSSYDNEPNEHNKHNELNRKYFQSNSSLRFLRTVL